MAFLRRLQVNTPGEPSQRNLARNPDGPDGRDQGKVLYCARDKMRLLKIIDRHVASSQCSTYGLEKSLISSRAKYN